MHDLLPIYRAIELIEARLRDDVTVSDMACAAGYSLYHFIRAFNQVVWHTPYDYLVRRRLSEAARDLVAGDRRVLDIAVEYRFNSHETFSRAFKRLFGVQPVQWRKRRVIPSHGLMPTISLSYLEHIHQPDFQRPQRVAVQARCLAGLMTALTSRSEVTDQMRALWLKLGRVKRSCFPDLPGENYFGVTSYLDEQGEQAFYLAACELDAPDNVAPVLVCQTLPGGDYVCLIHPGPLSTLSLSLTYLYHTWLPKAGLQPAYPLEIIAFGATPPWVEFPNQVMLWLPVMNTVPASADETPEFDVE